MLFLNQHRRRLDIEGMGWKELSCECMYEISSTAGF